MAKWTLLHDEEFVCYGDDNGNFLVPSYYDVGTEFDIVYNYQEADEQRVKYVRTKTCCNCDKLKPVTNETNSENYTYTYPSKKFDLTNVPLAVISAETSININDIDVFAYDDSITDIRIVESGDSIVSTELKNYITKKAKFGPQIFVIIGTLSEASGMRALRFGYSACGNECYNVNNPLYVYQRCACGMDNCRNEYDGGSVIQDRALYINSCVETVTEYDTSYSQVEFNAGDSICVETLYIKKVEYYTIDLNGNASPIQTVKTFNDNDGKGLWLRKKAATPINSVNPAFETDFHEEKMLLDYTNFLALDTEEGHTILYIYLVAFPTGTEDLPLGSMVQYVIGEKNEELSDRPNYEQVWRITYHTDSDIIIGGDDNGRCALEDFYVTIYVAPRGKKYYGDEGTRYDKKKEYKNCED